MPNKKRPRCPECDMAMSPLYVRRPRGQSKKRAGETFYCDNHNVLAKGRPPEVTVVQ